MQRERQPVHRNLASPLDEAATSERSTQQSATSRGLLSFIILDHLLFQ
jgi:hypothetical protein